jgi:hypothetical protein
VVQRSNKEGSLGADEGHPSRRLLAAMTSRQLTRLSRPIISAMRLAPSEWCMPYATGGRDRLACSLALFQWLISAGALTDSAPLTVCGRCSTVPVPPKTRPLSILLNGSRTYGWTRENGILHVQHQCVLAAKRHAWAWQAAVEQQYSASATVAAAATNTGRDGRVRACGGLMWPVCSSRTPCDVIVM